MNGTKIFQQTEEVINEGDKKCSHAFISNGDGKLSILKNKHVVERACFLCGRHVIVTTHVVVDNPFTFDKVIERFGGAKK